MDTSKTQIHPRGQEMLSKIFKNMKQHGNETKIHEHFITFFDWRILVCRYSNASAPLCFSFQPLSPSYNSAGENRNT